MIRKILIPVFFILLLLQAETRAQYDTVAILILDKMSDMIVDLDACSFKFETQYDVYNDELGLIKHSDIASVYLKGPDKLMVNKRGDRGHKGFWYNGSKFNYYSYDANQYATIDAPSGIIEMIDQVNKEYGVDFPAADLFYPSFVDDILITADYLRYLGLTNVDGKECFHIAGTSDDNTFQIWVANDEFFLPVKMALVYTNQTGNPQYEAVFKDWCLNPVLPDAMFEFPAPPKATKIELKKTNQ